MPTPARSGPALLAAFLFALWGVATHAQEPNPRLIELVWRASTTIPLRGVTHVVAVDDSIVRADVLANGVELFGLTRGETVIHAWVEGQRVSWRVTVVMAAQPVRRALAGPSAATGSHGVIGTSAQAVAAASRPPDYVLLHHFEWQASNTGKGLTLRGLAQQSTVAGANPFNLNTFSIVHDSRAVKLSFLDFSLDVNGNSRDRIQSTADYTAYPVRGFSMLVRKDRHEVEVFGGTTIPAYFRTLQGTRHIAGFTVRRQERPSLVMQTTAGWVKSPAAVFGLPQAPANSVFQTGGFQYTPNGRWQARATAGASTNGSLMQGAASYSGDHLTAIVTGNRIAPDFPLSQFQLRLFDGTALTGTITDRINSRLAASIAYEYHGTPSRSFLPAQSASDYLSANVSVLLSPGESLALNRTASHNRSGLALLGQSQAERYDISLNSRIGSAMNTAQITTVSQETSTTESQRELTWRDSLSVPFKAGSLTFGVQQARRDPSLVMRLKQETGVLTPALQELFAANPGVFAQEFIPPEIRRLLEGLDLTETQATVNGQLRFGRRLVLGPTVGYSRNILGLNTNLRSWLFGYSAAWQATSTVQVVSSVSNVIVFDQPTRNLQRSRIMTVGVNKSFTHAPLLLRPSGAVRGRVFRDTNLNGRFDAGELGLGGLRVTLGDHKTVLTDTQGRFEFASLDRRTYSVHVPLDQFGEAVRLTSAGDVEVDLSGADTASVEFGVVNFARVMGVAYNDYALDGRKRSDANGLRGIAIILSGNGFTRRLVTDGGGEYSLNDVPPGDYELIVDRTTLPPSFAAPERPIAVRAEAATTVSRDIPLRAIRSIGGRVYFKPSATALAANAGRAELMPVVGMQLRAGAATAVTGADGSFLFRDLPAGDLELVAEPLRPLPADLRRPSGKIRLPVDPIHIDDVTMVISNPELLAYFVDGVQRLKAPERQRD
jgi:SdrD B-like domain